jgi:hypothetical protein
MAALLKLLVVISKQFTGHSRLGHWVDFCLHGCMTIAPLGDKPLLASSLEP